MSRGDVWLHVFDPPDKRRPVLVVSNQDALDVMRTAIVAWIGSSRRGLPTEVHLDASHGLKAPCAANLSMLYTVDQSRLRTYVTTLPPDIMIRVCRALAIATGCR